MTNNGDEEMLDEEEEEEVFIAQYGVSLSVSLESTEEDITKLLESEAFSKFQDKLCDLVLDYFEKDGINYIGVWVAKE